MNHLKHFLSSLLITALAACGGGGGNSGTPLIGPSTSSVTDLVVVLSASTIANTGSESVTATVIALDSNRNAVAGVPVTLAVNSNAVITPSALSTGSSGTVTAAIGIGTDRSNRTITITATSGSIIRTAALLVAPPGPVVVASDLVVVLSSTTIVNTGAETVTATVTALDGNRNALQGAPVSVQVNSNATALVSGNVTDGSGKVTAALGVGADHVNRSILVTATSGSIVRTVTLLVISPGPVATAADLVLVLSASTVANTGLETVTATVTALDVNRNALAGVPVTVQVDNNAIASVNSAATDATGRLTATIGIGADRNNRTITVLAKSGNLVKAMALTVTNAVGNVAASDLVLVLSSDVIPNTGVVAAVATATALDANRNIIKGIPLTISVDANAVATPSGANTDDLGRVQATVAIGADKSPRTITVTARSGALSRSVLLQVTNQSVSALPTLDVALSSVSISAAAPATVTATLKDASGLPIPGQVITFGVVRALASTNVATALTDGLGRAVAVLSPSGPANAGADEVTARANVAGTALQASKGFQVQATNVTIDGFTSAIPSVSAYGQTSLTISLSGASVGSPVQVGVISACVSVGKAVLSPSIFTATTGTVTLQYKDNGCGAVQAADQLQATITGTATSRSLSLPLSAPSVSSLAFIKASPETIFLKASGYVEVSNVTFEVRDAAGNPLPNRNVVARLLTLTGGVTMEGGTVDVTRISDATGRISVRVNSGTQPTPVRVSATLEGTNISTVSSNLSVAVGLPSQLNFSLSQGTKNIEGYNIDGTPNTYQIIAADRNGNPVPAGTSINFVTEGGQIEPIKQTQLVSGLARTTANFVSAEPRPVDGRVTITSYALGEESFLDLNGNNIRDAGEPFQDLGNIFKDRLFDGLFDPAVDEYIPLAVNNSAACIAPSHPLLALDPSIPSMPGTCDGVWSGAGQVYVRRAAETVLSTSAGRPLWAGTSGLDATCRKVTLQVGPSVSSTAIFTAAGSDTWYGTGAAGTLSFIVGDANPGRVNLATGLFDPANGFPYPRLNPMAAGTTVTASTPTSGFAVSVGGGSPVPSTTEASTATVAYNFTDPLVSSGVVFVTFTSPSGVGSTVVVTVLRGGVKPSSCP